MTQNKQSVQRKNRCLFGTDGIRAHADSFPFTSEALVALGKAIAKWSLGKYGKQYPGVLIGHDTRISCSRIKTALVAGMQCFNLVVVDGGILPTPAVYQLIKDDARFDFGLVISASHNPYHDNGIKLFDSLKTKISKEDESIIENFFEDFYEPVETWDNAKALYQQRILQHFNPQFLSGIKIVLDCAHGATAKIAPELFTHLGAEVIALAIHPTGTNINDYCGSTHPQALQERVLQEKAHLGIAFDGDGDRLVFVNQAGVVKNGDDVLFLLLSLPEFATTETIVGTVMSNQGFENALQQLNKKLIRTPVGDKYVAQALQEYNLPLGGEISGHTIIQSYMPTSDGVFVALKVLEAVIQKENWQLETFSAYPQVLLNIPVVGKKDLSLPPLSTIITKYEKELQGGRVLVRYSGTENILRVMTEAASREIATNVAQALAHALQKELEK